MEDTYESGSWSPTTENLLESQYPLHRACRDGDLEALTSLLSVGKAADFYQEDGLYGWTPIHWAAYFGKLACLRKLVIERSIGLDTITSKFYQTALHLCAQSGHPHCLQWLVQSGANNNIQDYLGETPIHKSARTGNMECISLLISQGSKLSIKNHNGQTPSQLAADNGHNECAAYIERAAQLEQSQAVFQPVSPSNHLRTDHDSRVVPNGEAMEEDDDMETDLSVLPKGHRVNALAGTKRSREDCSDDECKKSRRDEPTHWNQNSFYQQSNGFVHHQLVFGQSLSGNVCFQSHGNSNFENGWFEQNGFVKGPAGFLPDLRAQCCNNNNINESTSTVEHYSSISQEQGYDSLLVESFANQYDGS